MLLTILAVAIISFAVHRSCHGCENASLHIGRTNVPEYSRIPRAVTSINAEVRPSTVLIEYRPSKLPICTGNILTAYVVLTAASCAYSSTSQERWPNVDIYVFAGLDTYEYAYRDPGRGIQVVDILVHPEYACCRRNDFDVALFKISRPFSFSSRVAMVQLSTTPLSKGMHECDLAGFGLDGTTFSEKINNVVYTHPSYPKKLRTLSVTKQCLCNRPWRRKRKDRTVRKPFICQHANLGKIEIVYADRGAGLMCGSKVYGIFTSTLKKDYRNNCSLNAEMFDSLIIDSIMADSYTLTFTDLCLSLRWINRHTDIFTMNQVSRYCGDKYLKKWRKMHDKANEVARKGVAARSFPSITTFLISSMIIFKSIVPFAFEIMTINLKQ